MAVQHIFHIERRNILAAGNDNVFRTVFDLRIAVGIGHRQIAGVKPAAFERGVSRLRILEIALHGDIAAKHDLTHGLAIPRHRLHGVGVHHHHVFLQ